ncbi:MAG TPA: hypothetical protein VN784_13950 [Candidatus Limnocylindrales bacterium]|nr:hypothetical protein [Candidatus Limnocylindrales bacterium]
MNWYYWHKELSALADDLSDRFGELAAESKLTGAVWLVEEVRFRTLIDEICKNYAETKSWPIHMTQKQIVLVYFRLVQGERHAQELAQGQHTLNQSPAELDLERAEALKLLLVDYWRSAGHAKWLRT